MAKSRVKKRADGRYMMQIYIGTVDGKKRYKYVYGSTPKEVERKAEEVKIMLNKGLDILSQRDKFEQWAEDFLKIKSATSITAGQKQNYTGCVNWWKDVFSGASISDIRADDIERALMILQADGKSARTISFYRSTVSQILKRAVGRILPSNPADGVSLGNLGKRPQARRALTQEEQHWIWETPHRAQPAAIIMMLSGLRRGELSALTWKDIDLKEKTISVSKTVEYPPKGKAFLRRYTKTEAGIRVVYIPQRLADYLKELPRKNILVYPSAGGQMMTANAWRAVWGSYMRELNRKYGERTPADKRRAKLPGRHKLDMTIPPITLHWLRHTFCTLMYFAGVPVEQACAQMGHADISTTYKIYTHLDMQYKSRDMSAMDSLLDDCQIQVKKI